MDYKRSLSDEERERLKNSRVAVIGCGGIGGYAAEELLRLGIGQLVAVDGDKFDASNLNRQILCTHESIGHNKAECVKQRAALIAPAVSVIAVGEYLTEENAERILSGCDLVIDALDSLEARRVLFAACSKLGIRLIYGAIGPWHVQVAVLPPHSTFLQDIPVSPEFHGETVLSFVPALCASVQIAEAVKLLCGGESALNDALCDIDLLSGEILKMEL